MPGKKTSLLQHFLDLTSVPSPSLHERGAAKMLARKIRDIGFEPLEDDAASALGGDCGNIIVKAPGKGKGPKLVLAAHLDTVERVGDPPARPVIEDEWVRREGGGIIGADDKAAVAVLLELMGKLKGAGNNHPDLLFVFTVAEEIECRGASELDPEQYRGYDCGVVLDYASPSEIVVAAPTKVAFRLTVNGIAGHAGAPERHLNAAHVMARTLAALPVGRLDRHTTANLGIMRSGNAINVIPDKAYAEYEIRSHRKDVLDFHVKRVIGIIEGMVRENRIFAFAEDGGGIGGETNAADAVLSANVDVDVEVCYEGFRLADNAKPVRLLKAAAKKAGLKPKTVVAQGGSDANIFNHRDLPCAVLGCGMHGAHGVDERANLNEMRDALDILAHLAFDS